MPAEIIGETIDTERLHNAIDFLLSLQVWMSNLFFDIKATVQTCFAQINCPGCDKLLS